MMVISSLKIIGKISLYLYYKKYSGTFLYRVMQAGTLTAVLNQCCFYVLKS